MRKIFAFLVASLIVSGATFGQATMNVYGLRLSTYSGSTTNGYMVYKGGHLVFNISGTEYQLDQQTPSYSLSSGRIPYWTGSTFANGAHWDNANTRLGIGASSPAAGLHILDATNNTKLILEGLSAAVYFKPTVSGIPVIASSTDIRFGTASSETLSDFSEKFRVNSSGVIQIATTPTLDNTNTDFLTRDGSGNIERRQIPTANGSNTGLLSSTDWTNFDTKIGLTDGDKGDVTVISSGASWSIDNSAVTYAKIQNVSAGSTLLGRGSSGSGAVQEITVGSGLTMSGTTLSQVSPTTTGNYTPTITAISNVSSSSSGTIAASWIRIGNFVTVFGFLSITPTASSTNTEFRINLPAATNFADGTDLGGSGTSLGNGVNISPVYIYSDNINDQARFIFRSTNTTVEQITFQFSYRVQ